MCCCSRRMRMTRSKNWREEEDMRGYGSKDSVLFLRFALLSLLTGFTTWIPFFESWKNRTSHSSDDPFFLSSRGCKTSRLDTDTIWIAGNEKRERREYDDDYLKNRSDPFNVAVQSDHHHFMISIRHWTSSDPPVGSEEWVNRIIRGNFKKQ